MKRQIFLVLVFAFLITASAGVRIKEIANFRGARDNQLFGYGLLVGLNGTGDSTKSDHTIKSLVKYRCSLLSTIIQDCSSYKPVG